MSTHIPILPTISDFAKIWHVCRFGRENVSPDFKFLNQIVFDI